MVHFFSEKYKHLAWFLKVDDRWDQNPDVVLCFWHLPKLLGFEEQEAFHKQEGVLATQGNYRQEFLV